MADKTGIEWTDATWNPIRGCSRVSEGCRNCYAESVAYRFSGEGQAYEGLVTIGADGKRKRQWNGQIKFVEERLLDPLKWKRPRRIFVNSMSDLFHENVTDAMRDRIFAVMALCPQHTFQVLTKRPERMRAYFADEAGVSRSLRVADAADLLNVPSRLDDDLDAVILPLSNVWLGTSVENQEQADKRIPELLKTPAAVRFISAEPLLGPVEISGWCSPSFTVNARDCEPMTEQTNHLLQKMGAAAYKHAGGVLLDWVICGGESGPGARPMHPDWARSLRDQCVAAGVPFFFKQWGEWLPWEPEQQPCWKSQNGKCEDHHALFPENIADDPKGWDSGLGFERETHAAFQCVGKKAAGHVLDGKAWHQFPGVR